MENMRKIVIGMDAGFAGTDSMEAWLVPVSMPYDEIDDFAWQRGVEHAESYGIYPRGEYDSEDTDEEGDQYSDNIEGWWEDYNPEKHDGNLLYGSSDKVFWNTY